MSINPNIDGSTVDPRWIDGGPGNPAPTFNIDDPTMWTPMTVISGLASGLCERAAGLQQQTASAFDAGYSPDAVRLPAGLMWDWGATTGNTEQTQRTANNIALHAGTSTLFTQSDNPLFQLPGDQAGNYMESFDSALSCLIAKGGYVTSGGSSFTLATLEQKAKDRASSAGSAWVDRGAGDNYTDRMSKAYPGEWAKERKWMLDELKYVNDPYALYYGAGAEAFCGYGTPIREITGAGITFSAAYTSFTVLASQTVPSDVTLYEITAAGSDCSYITVCRDCSHNKMLLNNVYVNYYATFSAYISPYVICRTDTWDEDPNPIYSMYIDAPYVELASNSAWRGTLDEDVKRQDKAIKLTSGSAIIYLDYGASNSYVIPAGASVTFLPNLSTVVLSNCTLDDCTLKDYNTYVQGALVMGPIIQSGTLTTARCMGTDISFNLSLDSNSYVIYADVDGVYTITDEEDNSIPTSCRLDSARICVPYSAVSSFLPLPNMGYVAGLSGHFPFFINTLHVSSGGIARIAPHYIRSANLNICSGGTVELVDDSGASADISITAGEPYNFPDGITVIPTVFGRYFYENKWLVYPESDIWWSRATAIFGATAAGTAYTVSAFDGQTRATWPGDNDRLEFAIVGGTYSYSELCKFNSAFTGHGDMYEPLIVGPAAKYIIDQMHGHLASPDYIIAGSGIIQQTVKNGIPDTGDPNMAILSGGTFSTILSVEDLADQMTLGIQIRPGGNLAFSTETYQPSLLYVSNNPNPYSRDYTLDKTVEYTYDTTNYVQTRYAWTSGGTTVWSDNTYMGGYNPPIYTTSDAYSPSPTLKQSSFTGHNFNIYTLYKNSPIESDAGIRALNLYSGGTLTIPVGSLTIVSGGIVAAASPYVVTYDVISSCTIKGNTTTNIVATLRPRTDKYYDVVYSNCAVYVNGNSVGTLNYGKGYNIYSNSFIAEGTQTVVSEATVIGGTVTLNKPFTLTGNLEYTTYNPLAMSGTGVSQGWVTASGEYQSDSELGERFVYMKPTAVDTNTSNITTSDVLAAMNNAAIVITGATVRRGNTAVNIGAAINSGAACVREGFTCYMVNAAAIVNTYTDFRCRQFYVDPDSATQTT